MGAYQEMMETLWSKDPSIKIFVFESKAWEADLAYIKMDDDFEGVKKHKFLKKFSLRNSIPQRRSTVGQGIDVPQHRVQQVDDLFWGQFLHSQNQHENLRLAMVTSPSSVGGETMTVSSGMMQAEVESIVIKTLDRSNKGWTLYGLHQQ
jgi:hypothetical protein